MGSSSNINRITGLPKGFGNLITLGNGGNISALSDIAAVAQEPVLKQTFTGSTVAEASGIIFRIAADVSTALFASTGTNIGIRIGGAGNPILKGSVYSSSSGSVWINNPLFEAHTSVQIDLYEITHNGVFLLPGSDIELTSSVDNLPSFTTIFAIPNTAKIYSSANQRMIELGNDTNEIDFFGVKLGFDNIGVEAIPIAMPVGNMQYSCNNTFDAVNLETRGNDGIYYSGGIGSNITVKNSRLVGFYDTMRLTQHSDLNLINNEFIVWAQEFTAAETAAAAFGQNTAVDLPIERYNIRGNTIICDTKQITGTEGVECNGLDFRNELGDNAIANIRNNYIRCHSHSTLTDGLASCVKVQSPGTKTPTINVFNNDLEAIKESVGGANYCIENTNANYTVNSAGNNAISGTNSTNVTSYSASLI